MLRDLKALYFVLLIGALSGCDPRPTERKIVGAWSWQYIEGRGRMVFTADHKVKEGFPPDESPGRPLRDDDFTYLLSGAWRLQGDVLVTEMDNSPHIAHFDEIMADAPEESGRGRPKLEKKTERYKIVKIDSEKMVFADGYTLDRDHRVK